MTDPRDVSSADPAADGGAPAPPEAGPATEPQWMTSDGDSQEAGSPPQAQEPLDVETLVSTLEAVTAERDTHLADLQRINAEYANFRKQAAKRQNDMIEHAATGLAEKLLPVLDGCEAAVAQGAADVAPIHGQLLGLLEREGLEVVTEAGEPFDPERHEAVMHEEGDGADPVVVDVMRAGYVWRGRVLRPAMVKVRG